jgi:hypothetical protein
VALLLGHLQAFPGQTWQQRWEASGLNDHCSDDKRRQVCHRGVAHLRCAGGTTWAGSLPRDRFPTYPEQFRHIANDPLLDTFFEQVHALQTFAANKREALFDVACALTVFGINADIKFSPHDFRRLFATELVNSGLPIHIGATLLGHLNIQTTRGYVNPRELHRTGENPQVACWDRRGNASVRVARHAECSARLA